jgi:alpha-mannosidase
MEKFFCVVSHTHWDREWYMPFEKFRIQLVDMMDNLLDILDKYPLYIFHLDAQSIIIEDYLEIKPYKRDEIAKYMKDGRLLAGPWYIQNDFYLTSGEATIRNLIIGSDIALKMGRCDTVGYAADQFCLISQLPQILNGFGIDNCIFGRGYKFYEIVDGKPAVRKIPAEFIWQGEDGSKVLAINMPYWYNNAQRFSEDTGKSLKLLEMIENNLKGVALTPYLLLMNGVDHLEAQENLMPIMDKLNKRLPVSKQIKQTTMQEYVDLVKDHIKKENGMNKLTVFKGEMKNGRDEILFNTHSSRIYLKVENVRAQNLLEARLEPLYSFIHMLCAKKQYPSDYLRHLWKLLLQNHPHDSICGCSRDEVHRHMEDRYERINEVCDVLLKRGMDFISAHVSREGLTNNDYILCVYNTIEKSRSGVIEFDAEFPVEENVEAFSIEDINGCMIPFEIIEKTRKSKGIFSPINLPGAIMVDCYKVKAFVDGIDGLSYKTLIIRPRSGECSVLTSQEAAPDKMHMENEYIKVFIHSNGRIDMLFKETGRLYENILMLEDMEDCGDSYKHMSAQNSGRITGEALVPEIRREIGNSLECRYLLTYNLKIPECFDEKKGKRSDSLLDNTVNIALNLKKGEKWLHMGFEIDNASKDHRLRVIVNTGIDGNYTYASIPLDVVKRDKHKVLSALTNGIRTNSGFVDIVDDKEGVAVLTEGVHEYEHFIDKKGAAAFTLLRANGWISKTVQSGIRPDETWLAPENQCIRKIRLNMALYPHTGNYIDSDACIRVKEFQNPLLTYFQPVDIRKFAGGRPAVQDSEIKEIFFRQDPFRDLHLPRELKLLEIKGKGIVLSALKKAEKDDRLIVRVYNSSEEPSMLECSYYKKITSACRTDMNEQALEELPFEGNVVSPITLKPKEILTIGLK